MHFAFITHCFTVDKELIFGARTIRRVTDRCIAVLMYIHRSVIYIGHAIRSAEHNTLTTSLKYFSLCWISKSIGFAPYSGAWIGWDDFWCVYFLGDGFSSSGLLCVLVASAYVAYSVRVVWRGW